MKYTISNDNSKQAVKDYIDRLKVDKVWIVDISRKKDNRSIDQNRLMWLWLQCIEQETGNDKELLHLYFKDKYLPKKEIILIDEIVQIPGSTAKLNTSQFTEYLEKIRIFANTELGIELPDPDSMIWESFYDSYKDKL